MSATLPFANADHAAKELRQIANDRKVAHHARRLRGVALALERLFHGGTARLHHAARRAASDGATRHEATGVARLKAAPRWIQPRKLPEAQ